MREKRLLLFVELSWLKGSRKRERRGVGMVAKDRNWSWTVAIEVYLSFNFDVAFDFMHFRFRQVRHNL
jgi:hypothetical protein